MGAVGRLRSAGLRLTVRDDRLLVEPRSALTEELREFIRSNKPAILQELATLERRCAVEARLQADPTLRIAADAADAPLRPEPGKPVLVVVAVRATIGIVSGEMVAPREKFDAALFFQSLEGNFPEARVIDAQSRRWKAA